MTKFRLFLVLTAAAALLGGSPVVAPALADGPAGAQPAQAQDPDAQYDRLDGRGTSGKRVDVVEWEGNLEVHVYPKGSLVGLALKLDKNNTVMVIGYRFNNDPKKQLIRRATLGVPFSPGFKTFKNTTEPDFDKIVISNNTLSGDLVAYKLDPTPTQLYPTDPKPKTTVADQAAPQNVAPGYGGVAPRAPSSDDDAAAPAAKPPRVDDNGTIQPFKW